MAKPDPWRLDPASYPHIDTVQTRFADLDVLGHINNVAMVALFETARTRFNHAVGLVRFRDTQWLIAAQEINYLAEGGFPTDVTMAHGIGRIGGRSWTIIGAAFQNGVPIATGDVTVVLDAPEMPADFRAALGEYLISR
ncbi:MAG: acyl-CoA thioesterase [Pseudomonadota bacterium]